MARYRVDKGEKGRRRRLLLWLVIILMLIGLGIWGYVWVRDHLKPNTVLKQAKTVVTTVNYNNDSITYTQPDFTIGIPKGWTQAPNPSNGVKLYTWQTSDNGSDGESLQIFEDDIPTSWPVNRALVVSGEGDHLQVDGQLSDDCSNFTLPGPSVNAGRNNVMSKWQEVSFVCDMGNPDRDVTGTTSTDGVNTVKLVSSKGVVHKFFFLFTNHSLNPDYTVYYGILESLKMR